MKHFYQGLNCLKNGGGYPRFIDNDTAQELITPILRQCNFWCEYGIRLQLNGAIYRPDSFVLMLRYCANLKAIRYESTSLDIISKVVRSSVSLFH